MAQNYNDTIHKMQTPFEMRAGLPKKEPKMLEDWEQNHVYEQMILFSAVPMWMLPLAYGGPSCRTQRGLPSLFLIICS